MKIATENLRVLTGDVRRHHSATGHVTANSIRATHFHFQVAMAVVDKMTVVTWVSAKYGG
jgi:hypothetical protein